MKAYIPDKSDDMFTTKERQLAPEGLIKMFLEREENAKRLETKTGKLQTCKIYFIIFMIEHILQYKILTSFALFQIKYLMAKETKKKVVLSNYVTAVTKLTIKPKNQDATKII